MVQTAYAQDETDDRQQIIDALAARPGQPLRLRLQPYVLSGVGQYKPWKNVVWRLGCATVEEAIELKDALRAFFEAVNRAGVAGVVAALDQIGR